MSYIADKINDTLKDRGWTPYRLAQETNLNYNTVNNYLKGRTTIGATALGVILEKLNIQLK